MTTVGDSSPLILYARIGRFELLHDIFTEVVVPPAVWDEVVTAGKGRPGAIDVASAPWIRRNTDMDESVVQALLAEVGLGEAQAIAVTLRLSEPKTLLLDDRKARRIAKGYGLDVTGSAGALGFAKTKGLISEVRPLLDQLRSAGLYLSDKAARVLLVGAGETDDEQDSG
jgi:uncharacterized protein